MTQQDSLNELAVNPTIEVGVGFKLRTRTAGARQTFLAIKDQPDVCRLLVDLVTAEWSAERIIGIPSPLLQQLIDFGVLVTKDEVDEVFYCCSLDQPPFETVPYRSRIARENTDKVRKYVVNRGVRLQTGPDPPPDLVDRVPFRDQFQQGDPIIWVEEPSTNVLAPYWLRPQFIGMLQRLLDGRDSPVDLPEAVSERLAFVRILVPKGYEDAEAANRETAARELRNQLASDLYAVLPKVIHPLQLAALRNYFRLLDRKGYLVKEPSRGSLSINRYIWHNEGVARFVHHQITGFVNQVVPEPVKPSYTYLATYKSGAVLPRHTDREQCAWNVSLLVDTNPEVSSVDSWPIYLDTGGSAKEVRLEMGDGILYRGTEIPHWREALPDGHIATLIFCHFVPMDFKESLL